MPLISGKVLGQVNLHFEIIIFYYKVHFYVSLSGDAKKGTKKF
jgi:hypothetical protein